MIVMEYYSWTSLRVDILWNNSIGNKLLEIKSIIGEHQPVVRNIRKEEVVLARLRLGHTRDTHSYLLLGEEHSQCVGCDAPFTVRHFLLECGDFAKVRNNCFHVENMLFQDIHFDSIMTFLRQINLFNKIKLLIAIFKILFCFTFTSDHNIDFLNVVLCSVKEHVQLSE